MSREDLYDRIDKALETQAAEMSDTEILASIAAYTGLNLRSAANFGLPLGEEVNPSELFSEVPGLSQDEIELDWDSDDDSAKSAGHHDWFLIVKKYPQVSLEEQAELAKIIEAGVLARGAMQGEFERPAYAMDQELIELQRLGSESLERMIVGNLGLVLYWARRTRRHNYYSIEDRFQDGIAGLMRAVEAWDYRRGYTFSTYAIWHIRQQISRQQQDHATAIRVPIHIQEQWAKARRLGVLSPGPLEEVRRMVYGVVSWEAVVDLEFEPRGPEIYEPFEEKVEEWSVDSICQIFISRLPPQQRDIINSRFGINRNGVETLDAIGTRYGMTRERIRQLEKKILSQAQAIYWTSIPWFQEAVSQMAGTRFESGATIAMLICADPLVSNGILARGLGIKRNHVVIVRNLIDTMAAIATSEVGPFGIPLTMEEWRNLLDVQALGTSGDEISEESEAG